MKGFDHILKKIEREFNTVGRSRFEILDDEGRKKLLLDKLNLLYSPSVRKGTDLEAREDFILYVEWLKRENPEKYGKYVDMDELIEMMDESDRLDEEYHRLYPDDI